MTGVAFTSRGSTGPLDTPLGAELRKIEKRIIAGEGQGIEARWEFGRELLRQRKGKQLPKGLLAAVVQEHGISRSEVQYRIQFAETFPTKDEVSNALDTFPTWRQVIREALPKPERQKAAANVVSEDVVNARRFRKNLAEKDPKTASEAFLRELDKLQEAIADFYAARENTIPTPRKRTSK